MGKQVAARLNGGIAQLGEHLPCKQGVRGSNPLSSTEEETLQECKNMLKKSKVRCTVYLENFIQRDNK